MAIFHPSLEEQVFFSTPLEEGEVAIRDLLGDRLDDSWHVFVQPHLLNQQPDFLLVHKEHGATVLEVKDWRPGGHRAVDGHLEVMDKTGEWHFENQDPVQRVHQYKSNISERFLTPPAAKKSNFGDVHTTVVLPRWEGVAASRVLKDGSSLLDQNKKWIHVAGKEVFTDEQEFMALVHGSPRAKGRGLSVRIYERFLNRLLEPEAVSDQRLPLRLSKGAQNIAENPNRVAIRRVRGSAGSGKTLALAARAGNLAKSEKNVLVLTFNITLANYVDTLVGRWCRQVGADRRRVSCIHFHGFCADVLDEWRYLLTTDAILLNRKSDSARGTSEGGDEFEEMVDRTRALYEKFGQRMPHYDAVLVDEGQDFKPEWWNFLRHHVVRQAGGEMLLIADTSQDIYGRRKWTEERSMRGLGFRSRWKSLSGSYRLPVDFVPILREFADAYIGEDASFPTVPVDHLASAAQHTVRRWVNSAELPDSEVARAAVEEVRRILDADNGPHPADVTVLAESHKYGQRVMNLLEDSKVVTEHIFFEDAELSPSENIDRRRLRKIRFYPGVAMLKGSTVHSFKGWESRGVVYLLQGNVGDVGRFVYTALSRLKGDPANRPAFITVINLNPSMNSFKEIFERRVSLEEIDDLTSDLEVFKEQVKGRIVTVEGDMALVRVEGQTQLIELSRSTSKKLAWPPRQGDRIQGTLVFVDGRDDDSYDFRIEKARFVGEELF